MGRNMAKGGTEVARGVERVERVERVAVNWQGEGGAQAELAAAFPLGCQNPLH